MVFDLASKVDEHIQLRLACRITHAAQQLCHIICVEHIVKPWYYQPYGFYFASGQPARAYVGLEAELGYGGHYLFFVMLCDRRHLVYDARYGGYGNPRPFCDIIYARLGYLLSLLSLLS